MRSRHVVSIALLVGLVAPLVSASEPLPGHGDLAFGSAPMLDGTVSAQGQGEVRFPDSGALAVLADAPRVTVLRVWHEETHVRNPLGGSVVADAGETKREETPLTDVQIRLGARGEGFLGFVYTENDGTLQTAPTPIADHALIALESPSLVVDEGVVAGQARQDDRVFTWKSTGPRFSVPAHAAEFAGTFTLYAWDATFHITGSDGEREYRSGITTTDEASGTTTVLHEYHLLKVEGGTGSLDGADGAAWLHEPTIAFDGRLTANPATGTMTVGSERHDLESEAVTIEGSLLLTPRPAGEPVPEGSDADAYVDARPPNDGIYPGAESSLDGDVTLLATGIYVPAAQDSNLAIAATVGVATLAGALFLATPQGKWLLWGLIAPLYAKTSRDQLLANESRERIFHVIRTNPGINLSQVGRVADLGWGVTVYHLKMMEKNGLIFSERGTRDKCFFENTPRYRALRVAISAIANKEPVQRIATVVADHPGLTQTDVITHTGLSQRAVSYYLGKLQRSGLVDAKRDGNFVHYAPREPLPEALEVVIGIDGDAAATVAVPHAPPVNA